MKNRVPETVVSIAAIALALARMFLPEDLVRIDSTTLAMLVVAAVPWLFPFLKSLTLPGGTVVEFREQLRDVEKKVDLIEDRGRLPGRPEPIQSGTRQLVAHGAAPEDEWNTDPHKGQFGGSPAANGLILGATLEPAAGPTSAAINVWLSVRSTDPTKPLTGRVTFYLHPTFGNQKQLEVRVVDGVAMCEITSWGVFTVGAVADDGGTPLELDLARVKGGPPKFYAS